MARNYPPFIPFPWSGDDLLTDAYKRGWSHGHGVACHNKPDLGKVYTTVDGHIRANAGNIRELHQDLTNEAADNSRQFSPFELTAKAFNDSEYAEDLWGAFEAGTYDAIVADLQEYTDEDYGIDDTSDEEYDI